MIYAYRLFTGSDDDSHLQRGHIPADAFISAGTVQFRETPAGTSRGLHAAPAPQCVLMLTGVVEFTTQSGETFTTHPGDVLLVTDCSGSGHAWRVIGDEPWKRACVTFGSLADDLFISAV